MPGVDQRIFSKSMLNTPEQITPAITAMCMDLSPNYVPGYVEAKPAKSAKPRECFFNVRHKIERDGGEMLYGWAIWEWRRVFIEAEHHAVWLHEGVMLDITPHVPETDRVLFLPDPSRAYDFVHEKRTPNFKRSLEQLSMVDEYFKAFDEMLQYVEDNSKGRLVTVNPRRMNALQHRAMTAQASVFVALAETTDPNDRCFCASKRKFKNCCAPLIHLNV